MTKAVVWGVENTLITMPDYIREAIPERTIDAVRKLVPIEKPINPLLIRGMAREAFNASGMPCKEVAATYKLDEGILTGEMYNLLARRDVWTRAAMFARPSQHWLNLFEKSKRAGIKHFAVTSGSSEWGRVSTQAVGVNYFMDGVVGSDYTSRIHGSLVNKYVAGTAVITALTEGKFAPADVLVVDSDLTYVDAARRRGFQAVQVNEDMTVSKVFARNMDITAPQGRKNDGHIYAGIAPARSPEQEMLRARMG